MSVHVYHLAFFRVCSNALSVCGVRRQRRGARSTQNGSTKMAGPACCWAVRERAPQVCCRQPTHSARCIKKKQTELEHGRADALCWRGCGGHPEPARPAASLRRVHMPAAPQHRSSSAASLSCGRIWHAGHKRASDPRCASSLHFPTHASIKDSTHHSLRPWRRSAMLPGESRPGRPLLLRGGPPRRRCLPPAGQTRGRTRARGAGAPAQRSGAARGPRSAAPSGTPARPRPPPARAAAGWCAWGAGSHSAPARARAPGLGPSRRARARAVQGGAHGRGRARMACMQARAPAGYWQRRARWPRRRRPPACRTCTPDEAQTGEHRRTARRQAHAASTPGRQRRQRARCQHAHSPARAASACARARISAGPGGALCGRSARRARPRACRSGARSGPRAAAAAAPAPARPPGAPAAWPASRSARVSLAAWGHRATTRLQIVKNVDDILTLGYLEPGSAPSALRPRRRASMSYGTASRHLSHQSQTVALGAPLQAACVSA